MVQIDIEQPPLPLTDLARNDHGLDVRAVHQRDDRPRHLVERRHVERGGVEDDDIGFLARLERAGLVVEPEGDTAAPTSLTFCQAGSDIPVMWTNRLSDPIPRVPVSPPWPWASKSKVGRMPNGERMCAAT